MKYYFQCPRCGEDERFIKPQEHESNSGWTMLFFGGLIPALLYADHARHRVECETCRMIFRQPSRPNGPVARFTYQFLSLVFILIVLAIIFFFLPDLADSLPSLPLIATLEAAVAAQPRVAAYLIVCLCVLPMLLCWAATSLNNYKFRKQLSKEVRLDVPEGHDSAPPTDLPPTAAAGTRPV